MGVAADHQAQRRVGEQQVEGVRRRGRGLVGLRVEADHVVVADPVTQQQVAAQRRQAARHRQGAEEPQGVAGEEAGLVRERLLQQPAVVIAAHHERGVGGQQGAAAVEAAGAVDEVADREHGVDALSREPGEDKLEAQVLAVQVTDRGEAAERGGRRRHGRGLHAARGRTSTGPPVSGDGSARSGGADHGPWRQPPPSAW